MAEKFVADDLINLVNSPAYKIFDDLLVDNIERYRLVLELPNREIRGVLNKCEYNRYDICRELIAIMKQMRTAPLLALKDMQLRIAAVGDEKTLTIIKDLIKDVNRQLGEG